MEKIALVTDCADWVLENDSKNGGVGVVARKIYSNLVKRGFSIKVLAHKGENKTFDNTEICIIDLPPESDEYTKQLDVLTKDCDRIFTFHFDSVYEGVILQSHSSVHRVGTNGIFSFFKRLLYTGKILGQTKIYTKAQNFKNVYAVSNILKNDYEKNFGIKNIKVLYPGCDRIYDEFPKNKSEILTFGIVANSSINKGGHSFVLAFGIAKMLGLKCNLKIIAPKFKKDIIMKFLVFIFGLGKTTEVLPRQEDMSYFYQNIDCLVMPSVNEAFGLVALESLSYGKTCLVSDTTGFSEILGENDGFKFNRKSFLDFIKVILNVGKIYYGDRERFNEICKNGWELSLKYTWENFINNLLA